MTADRAWYYRKDHGMTMASRGQAAHKPDPKPSTIAAIEEGERHIASGAPLATLDDVLGEAEDREVRVERVARAMWETWGRAPELWDDPKASIDREQYRTQAGAAIAAMGQS